MIPRRLVTTWICNETEPPYTAEHVALFERCLRSWQKLMPDWEIIIVRHSDLITRDDEWLQIQLREERWIGASQWARLQWLYEHGGIYVDMDVEAIRSFEDLRHHSAFFGAQKDGFVNNAVMGSVPRHPFFAEQMDYIKTCDPLDPQFGNETGPRMVTKLLQQRQHRTVMIYPPAVFYPYHWDEPFSPNCIKPETVAVHHWAGSWCQNGF